MAVETIGEAWDLGWRMQVRCAWGKRAGMKTIRECDARHDVDLPTLVWTRGRDCPLDLLAERMRCPRCGSRRIRLIFIPPAGADAGIMQAVSDG